MAESLRNRITELHRHYQDHGIALPDSVVGVFAVVFPDREPPEFVEIGPGQLLAIADSIWFAEFDMSDIEADVRFYHRRLSAIASVERSVHPKLAWHYCYADDRDARQSGLGMVSVTLDPPLGGQSTFKWPLVVDEGRQDLAGLTARAEEAITRLAV